MRLTKNLNNFVKAKKVHAFFLFLFFLMTTSSASAQNSQSLFQMPKEKSQGVVENIINSATLRLVDGRKIKLIGLIPLNKPKRKELPRNEYNIIIEKEDPIIPFEQTAYDFVNDLVIKKNVRLEFDNQYLDPEGYVLAYVFLPDGTFVNAEIIRQGFSDLHSTPSNTKYAQQLRAAYLEAKKEKRGLQGN